MLESSRLLAGDWIPLMDYAIKKGVSLSTLRRHIKANKVQYKVENGKYLLFDDEMDLSSSAFVEPQGKGKGEPIAVDLQLKVQKLENELKRAHEEIGELKMLIALYEETIPGPRLDN